MKEFFVCLVSFHEKHSYLRIFFCKMLIKNRNEGDVLEKVRERQNEKKSTLPSIFFIPFVVSFLYLVNIWNINWKQKNAQAGFNKMKQKLCKKTNFHFLFFSHVLYVVFFILFYSCFV